MGPPERDGKAAANAAAEPVPDFTQMMVRLGADWREAIAGRTLAADVLAAVTVAAVALPLNLALAVACNLPPIMGLVAGAVGGVVAASLGGAPLQVTGPAAALSTAVLSIGLRFGAQGVAAAAVFVGIVQLGLGFLRTGQVSRHFPESVLAGFTTGVGLKLLDSQIPEVLGFDLRVADMLAMMHRPAWLHQVSWEAALCGLFVAFVVTSTARFKRFPSAIVAIALVTYVSAYVQWPLERIGALPSRFPTPSMPGLRDEQWVDLFVVSAPLAVLAAVESLLSARALDRMTGGRPHDSNLELLGQGTANVAVGMLGGMPVTGVVVRSSVNVQSGGRTRLAALLHGALLALCVVKLGPLLAHIPLAALAGLLCVIGYRLLELRTLTTLAQHEKIEALAFLAAAGGTVSGHLMTGLVLGGALHALHRWIAGRAVSRDAIIGRDPSRGLRAVVAGEGAASTRKPGHAGNAPEQGAWLRNIRQKAVVHRSAFVHDKSTLIGRVVLGRQVHVAAGASVRADEGTPFYLGDHTNVQDGVVIHALKERHVRVHGEEWAVYVGRNVSIAHDALVHGPCFIGDDTFVGFKAVVHDSIVGRHCYIGIGAVVVGVEIPDGRRVPHGAIVDTADAVERLPPVEDAHRAFNEDVVEVNRGLTMAYHAAGHLAGNRPAPHARQAPSKRPVWDERWDEESEIGGAW